jgi:Spy/CpxP family protein refolding chaperone
MSRIKLVTLIAIPLVIAGALAFAHQSGGHHGAMHSQPVEAHLDRFAGLLTKIGASDAQKSQIEGLLRGTFDNVGGLREGHHAALGQMHELLFAPTIDRAKMESLRAQQIKSLDDASRDLVTTFQAAAEVLSPEQRAALAQEMRRIHGG